MTNLYVLTQQYYLPIQLIVTKYHKSFHLSILQDNTTGRWNIVRSLQG